MPSIYLTSLVTLLASTSVLGLTTPPPPTFTSDMDSTQLASEDKAAIFQALPGLLFSTILRNGNPANIKNSIANSNPIRPWNKAIKRSPSSSPYDPNLTKEQNQEQFLRLFHEKWTGPKPAKRSDINWQQVPPQLPRIPGAIVKRSPLRLAYDPAMTEQQKPRTNETTPRTMEQHE